MRCDCWRLEEANPRVAPCAPTGGSFPGGTGMQLPRLLCGATHAAPRTTATAPGCASCQLPWGGLPAQVCYVPLPLLCCIFPASDHWRCIHINYQPAAHRANADIREARLPCGVAQRGHLRCPAAGTRARAGGTPAPRRLSDLRALGAAPVQRPNRAGPRTRRDIALVVCRRVCVCAHVGCSSACQRRRRRGAATGHAPCLHPAGAGGRAGGGGSHSHSHRTRAVAANARARSARLARWDARSLGV